MINDADLGEIKFIINERAKRINVRININNIVVTLPKNATQYEALNFINSVRDRLLKKQKELQLRDKNKSLLIDEDHCLQTLTFVIKAIPAYNRDKVHFCLNNNELIIEYPTDLNCTSEQSQKYFWKGINYFLEKEAKKHLPERTKQLAENYNFSFSSVKIQSSKTRWGSCSSKGNINLSYYLMLLPPDLIDYVILHELCHTKEMNHSNKFWSWMDCVTENKSKTLRTELKKYRMPNY